MARRRYHEVEVDLDDFTDEEILQEVELRQLDARTLAADVQNLLCAHRDKEAHRQMKALLQQLLPADVWEAYECMQRGKWSEAICRPEAYLYPSPAAQAKKLPEKPKTLETAAP